MIDAIYAIAGIFGAIVLGYVVNDMRYQKAKKILKAIREMVDHVDEAVYDDKITEEEFRGAWEHLKGLIEAIQS